MDAVEDQGLTRIAQPLPHLDNVALSLWQSKLMSLGGHSVGDCVSPPITGTGAGLTRGFGSKCTGTMVK